MNERDTINKLAESLRWMIRLAEEAVEVRLASDDPHDQECAAEFAADVRRAQALLKAVTH